MQDKILFEEKQYIGYNKWAILWRTVLALFSFVLYYWSENPKPIDVSGIAIPSSPVGHESGHLFFLMGVIITLLSLSFIFILHIHTKVINNELLLNGLWTSRNVKINLNDVVEVKKIKSRTFFLNPPTFNLHFKNKIYFYTQGNDAVELTDKNGLTYSIGSQKADELANLLLSLSSSQKV